MPTAQSDEGHTGLDRENNQDPNVNKDAKTGGAEDPTVKNPMEQRKEELTDDA